MQQLLYAAEVREIGELEIPSVEVKDAELKLARQLIGAAEHGGFRTRRLHRRVRERIEAAVEKKVEGQEITVPEEAAGGAQIIDLMEALRLSLEKKGTASAPLEGTRKPPSGSPRLTRPGPHRRKEIAWVFQCTNTVCAWSRSCCSCRAARSVG